MQRNIEKLLDQLTYQEKQLYLALLTGNKERNDIVMVLKDSNNFFLQYIDIEALDILGLVRLYHAFVYNKLVPNSSAELKRRVYIETIYQLITEDEQAYPYYFKYLDFEKFAFDDLQRFFRDLNVGLHYFIQVLKTRKHLCLPYMDITLMSLEELEEFYIQTHPIVEESWVESINLWSKEYKLNLPTSKEELKTLKKLTVRDTNIKYIPKEIAYLESLVEIDFSNINNLIFDNNTIKEIPKELYFLPHLEVLNMSNVGLTKIPSGIRYLSNLIKLDISQNALQEVPREITQLHNLQELNLYGNKLKTVSSGLLSSSKIELPKDFMQLKNLQYLDDQKVREEQESIEAFFARKNYILK